MTHIDITANGRQRATCHICGDLAGHSLTVHGNEGAAEVPICENHGVRLSQIFRL